MKKILLIAATVAALGGVTAIYADGEWLRAGPVWLKGLVYAGTSKIALTNAAGNLSTTTGAFSGNVTVTGTVAVTGASTLRSTLAVTDSATFSDEVLFADVSAGQTASAGSAQGSGPMTVTAIQATVIATAGDNFTLPTAVAGMVEFVCNADASGTDAMDLFPASGAAINKESANAAISLAHGECAFCIAFSTTSWGCVIGSAN